VTRWGWQRRRRSVFVVRSRAGFQASTWEGNGVGGGEREIEGRRWERNGSGWQRRRRSVFVVRSRAGFQASTWEGRKGERRVWNGMRGGGRGWARRRCGWRPVDKGRDTLVHCRLFWGGECSCLAR
jgi:hypothetical protein